MRRLVLIGLLALAVPGAAFALPHDRGDGTLVVKNASGKVALLGANGSVLGHVDKGQLYIYDWHPFDDNQPDVYGADKTVEKTVALTVYTGAKMRFRFIGARNYSIRISGTGIDVSAVGEGRLALSGAGTLDDGQYSVDNAAFQTLPLTPFSGVFGQPPAPPVAGG